MSDFENQIAFLNEQLKAARARNAELEDECDLLGTSCKATYNIYTHKYF